MAAAKSSSSPSQKVFGIVARREIRTTIAPRASRHQLYNRIVRSFIRALRVLHREYRQSLRSAMCLGLAAIASPALATNLVFNPGFYGSLAGWMATSTTFDDT